MHSIDIKILLDYISCILHPQLIRIMFGAAILYLSNISQIKRIKNVVILNKISNKKITFLSVYDSPHGLLYHDLFDKQIFFFF